MVVLCIALLSLSLLGPLPIGHLHHSRGTVVALVISWAVAMLALATGLVVLEKGWP
jgi:hypothetical protein